MIKVGDIVQVNFLDHVDATGSDIADGPMVFTAYGKVLKITKFAVTVSSWIDPKGQIDHNTDIYVILRSTIRKIRRLR